MLSTFLNCQETFKCGSELSAAVSIASFETESKKYGQPIAPIVAGTPGIDLVAHEPCLVPR